MYKIKRFNNTSDDAKRTGKEAVGTGLIIEGGSLIRSSNKEGELTGRVRLHHSTAKKNVKSLLENGMDGSFSKDPTNLTNSMLKGAGARDSRDLIYLAKDRELAEDTSAARRVANGSKSKILNVSIPYEDLKKLRTEGNPELLNAKTYEEYRSKLRINGIPSDDTPNLRNKWNKLSGDKSSRTVLVEGKLDPKYIKESKHYKKLTPKELMDYAKKNPKRFMKSAGKVVVGTAAVGTGVKIIKDSNKSSSKSDSHLIESSLALGGSAVAGKMTYDKTLKRSIENINNKFEPVIERLDAALIRNDRARVMTELIKNNPGKYKPGTMDLMNDAEFRLKGMEKSTSKAKDKAVKLLDKSKKLAKLKSLGKAALVSGGLASSYAATSKLRSRRSKDE